MSNAIRGYKSLNPEKGFSRVNIEKVQSGAKAPIYTKLQNDPQAVENTIRQEFINNRILEDDSVVSVYQNGFVQSNDVVNSRSNGYDDQAIGTIRNPWIYNEDMVETIEDLLPPHKMPWHVGKLVNAKAQQTIVDYTVQPTNVYDNRFRNGNTNDKMTTLSNATKAYVNQTFSDEGPNPSEPSRKYTLHNDDLNVKSAVPIINNINEHDTSKNELEQNIQMILHDELNVKSAVPAINNVNEHDTSKKDLEQNIQPLNTRTQAIDVEPTKVFSSNMKSLSDIYGANIEGASLPQVSAAAIESDIRGYNMNTENQYRLFGTDNTTNTASDISTQYSVTKRYNNPVNEQVENNVSDSISATSHIPKYDSVTRTTRYNEPNISDQTRESTLGMNIHYPTTRNLQNKLFQQSVNIEGSMHKKPTTLKI